MANDVFSITRDFENLSNFEVGQKVLRAIALNPNSREASRIQAAMALIRSVEIGQDLPKSVREGQEKTTLEEEREKLLCISQIFRKESHACCNKLKDRASGS